MVYAHNAHQHEKLVLLAYIQYRNLHNNNFLQFETARDMPANNTGRNLSCVPAHRNTQFVSRRTIVYKSHEHGCRNWREKKILSAIQAWCLRNLSCGLQTKIYKSRLQLFRTARIAINETISQQL